jgi:peptidyl-prolyl cis-trans isomerase C
MFVRFQKCFLTLAVFLLLTGVCFSAPAEEKKAPEDNIAMVNGVAIPRADFDREFSAVQMRLSMQGQAIDDTQISAIKNNILESLISRELLYQESQKVGIKAEDKAVEEEFSEWRKQFPDEAQFKEMMANMNLSEDILKAEIRQRMVIEQFIEKQFTNLSVSDKEIKEYYDTHPDLFKQPEQVKASHILIKVDPKAEESKKTEARKKIEGVQERLKKGEDFATVAKEVSEGPSNVKGGDLGYFERGQMVKPFEDVAFALTTGEISSIVETQFGYHLIKSFDKKPETTAPYTEIKDRLGEYLKQEKKMKEIRAYGDKLKENAKIETFLQ